MNLIEVKDLHKIYEEGGVATPVLNGMSFNIAEGEFVAIMGPSGSGKSTLLHILGFLDRPTQGSYLFEGKESDKYTDDELAGMRNKDMGFVFQSFNLLPRVSILENVILPLQYSKIPLSDWRQRATASLDAVGLSHRLLFEPSQLSGGEKQRAAIARALVLKPRVIFADEPTGNLDSKSGQVVIEILQRLNKEQGHTIILITHETYTAEHAGRIIHLLDGHIEQDKKVIKQLEAKDGFIK